MAVSDPSGDSGGAQSDQFEFVWCPEMNTLPQFFVPSRQNYLPSPIAESQARLKVQAKAAVSQQSSDQLRFAKMQAEYDQIKLDQQALRTLGYYQGDVDGKAGNATMSAISAFRAAHNLTPGTTLDAASRQMIRDGKVTSKAAASPRVAEPATTRTLKDDQQALADLGFYQGKVDGLTGPQTRRAIRQFKSKYRFNSGGDTLDASAQRRLAQEHEALAKQS